MDETTEEIRRRADIVEIVGQHVALKPAGGERFKACCPFHDEKTPSFYVSRDRGFYKCFGCLEADEPIWTQDGLKRIGDVAPGERVLDRNAQWQDVVLVQRKTGPLLRVSTRGFRYDPLRLTPDHTCLFVRRDDAVRALPYLYHCAERGTRLKGKYRRYRNKTIVVTQGDAATMRAGDFLLFPVVPEAARHGAPLLAPEAIREYSRGKKTRRVESLPVNERAARLYGLYLAEGSTSPRSVFWTFHINESATFGNEVVEILCEQFGLPASVYLHPHKNTCSVVCSKTDLARQFERWLGKGCANKRLPAEALCWPREVQRALLRGYRDGDGDAHGNSASVSRELSYGLFALCIQTGERPSLNRHQARVDKNDVSHRAAWSLRSNQKDRLAGFFQEIDGTNYFWSQISNIKEESGAHPVVDITVTGSSSFVTKMGAVHNCGESGDVFKFLQKIENITFPEAKRQLAERYGIALPKSNREYSPEQIAAFEERDRLMKITEACAAFFREQFAGNKGLAARDYARTRGLSGATIEKFSIGAAPDAWDSLHHFLINQRNFKNDDCVAAGVLIAREREENGVTRVSHYDRYRHRLMFPIWDWQGRVIAFGGRALEGGQTGTPDAKYINSPEGPLFSKSKVLYGWHLARPEVGKRESIIITEGYMDAIALHEAGFGNTIATLGTALTALHVIDLARLAPKTVYLCYDGDSAGMKAALRSAALFAQHDLTVRVVALPSGDDPDTFIRKHGAGGFENALKRASLLTRYRVEMAIAPFDLSQLAQRMEAIRAAADIVAEVNSDIEKDDYVAWLGERWAQAEGVTAPARLQMIQAAVRREVGQAAKRTREAERDKARAKSGAPPETEEAASTREAGSAFNQKREWLPREEFLRRRREEESGSVSLKSGEEVDETLSASSGALSGIAKAERILLASLLGNPSWRSRILGDMPPHLWTRETHREIAQALRQIDWNEPVEAATLVETLPLEAADLVGELMLSDQAQIAATEEVLRDCVARVKGYWARRAEAELLEMITLKLKNGESVSDAEREQLNAALIATKRKQPETEAA